MTPGPVVLRVAAALCASVPLLARPQQVFRGGTDIVQLNVTVADASQHFVGGLERDDFQVFEDGVLQDVSLFVSDRQPLAMSILIDSSTSMDSKIAVAQEAAVGFAKRLGEHDLAEVIEFNSHERKLLDFTHDRAALDARHSTDEGRRLDVAVQRDLRRAPRSAHTRASLPGDVWRQAIVVLSDGEDTTSLKTYDDVLDEAKRAQAVIYAIGLRSKEDTLPRHGFSEGDFVMRSFAQETGGLAFFVEDLTQLGAVYAKIADELSNQYVIGYTSKNHRHDGAWRKIAIRVTRPGMKARTRTGYFAPAVDR